MANLHWNKEKAPFDEAKEKIKALVIEATAVSYTHLTLPTNRQV